MMKTQPAESNENYSVRQFKGLNYVDLHIFFLVQYKLYLNG